MPQEVEDGRGIIDGEGLMTMRGEGAMGLIGEVTLEGG